MTQQLDMAGWSLQSLVEFYERTKALHTGIADKEFMLAEIGKSGPSNAIRLPCFPMLGDLLFRIQCEAFNELHRRFPKELDLSKLDGGRS
jgi:hypothetical protein